MKKAKKVLFVLFIVFCSFILMVSTYIKKVCPDVIFEELYFYLVNGASESDGSLVLDGFKYCVPLTIFLSAALYIILSNLFISTYFLKKIKKEKLNKLIRALLSIVLLVVSLYISMNNLNFISYIKYQNQVSSFIEDNYVDPKTAKVTFPEKKRNLITIFVESLETSMFKKDNGGYWDYEVIPELYELLNDENTVVFYDNNKTELMNPLDSSAWTTGGDVANTSALPLKIPIQRSSYHSKNFMAGAYSIGELLKDNGYYNEYISSARTSFGGINEYFTTHGKYNILDINTYGNYQLSLDDKNRSKWGFNDEYMFQIAKKRLNIISKKDKPFNLALQTIDTHYVDGYIGWYSKNEYDSQYENVYATESMLISDFIKWVKKQDFYDNTTIMIVGDHISMQTEFFKERGAKKRYIYNCYINPANKKGIKQRNRIYTALDSYPTSLGSLGIDIKGNRLGLGTNMFSKEKTLSEKYGISYVNKELNKKSVFYNSVILGDDYNGMISHLEKKDIYVENKKDN